MNNLTLSPLGHTWIFDLDGTIVKHNGYKTDGKDTLNREAADFLASLPKDDLVIIVTSRTEEYAQSTKEFLRENHVRYEHIIFNAPFGERIIVNDRKPSGLDMSKAVNFDRDRFSLTLTIDDKL